jgi:hypothetical protein
MKVQKRGASSIMQGQLSGGSRMWPCVTVGKLVDAAKEKGKRQQPGVSCKAGSM